MAETGLNREQIVAEAIALLRDGGLEDVSLRKIGARLGVKAPSLYWHVESKEALYALMSSSIFRSCLNAIPPCRDWCEWLREFALSIWRAQQAVPDIRRLIVMAPVDAQTREHTLAIIVAELSRLGLDPTLAVPAQKSIQALVTGWTTLGMRSARLQHIPEDHFQESLDALIGGWALRADKLFNSAKNALPTDVTSIRRSKKKYTRM